MKKWNELPYSVRKSRRRLYEYVTGQSTDSNDSSSSSTSSSENTTEE